MKIKRIMSLLLVIALCLAVVMPVMALETSKDTLKVAFTELPGFFEYDENNNMVGYGIDYFNELSVHTGCQFTFVDVGVWENAFPALKSGEVDIVVPSTAPSDPAASPYIRSKAHIIENYMAVMALASSDGLYYEDYETINNLKIAMTPSVQNADSVQTFLQENGLSPQMFIYDTTNECKTALENGTVDAIVSNIMDVESNYKTLAKFGYSDGLVAMLRGRENDLAVLNDALQTIQSNHPYFEANLNAKWFPERSVTPYTKEQAKLIESHNTFNVVVAPDRYPVTYMDESSGEFSGIAIDILNLLAEKTGLTFNYISGGTQTSPFDSIKNPDVDLVLTSLNKVDADNGIVSFVTNDILASDVNFATRNGVPLPKDRNPVIAMPKSFRGLVSTLSREVPDIQIKIFETIDECISAVRQGKADGIALDTYLMYELLNSSYYDDFKIIQSYSVELPYHIAATADVDPGFTIILNYGIARISSDEISDIVAKYTTYEYYSPSIGEKIYSSRQVIAFFAVILLIICICIFLWNRQKKKYAAALIKKNDDLVRATNAKSEFLSNMSHDIRTPMTAILNLTDLSLEEIEQPELLKEDLSKIKVSGHYLLGLLNDVLDMSRIESGKMTLKPSVYTHTEFVDYMDSMTTPLCKQRGIRFDWDKGTTGYDVYVDITRFNQVFYNILSNAIKYTPEGGSVSLLVKNNHVKDGVLYCDFVIQDTGIGMSEEFQKKLFVPFERAENVHAYNGTGLGLSITKQIVELMNGTIHVDSELGKGTTVTLTLPMPIATEEQCRASLSNSNAVKTDKSACKEEKQSIRILLAEDHQLNQEIITRLLKKKNYEVESTSDGTEALSAFSDSSVGYYAAVIMDIRMPIMDGLSAAQAIRELDRPDAKTIPIIAMSANAYDEDVKKSLDAGMNVHLSKPIEPEKLYETLAQLIQ